MRCLHVHLRRAFHERYKTCANIPAMRGPTCTWARRRPPSGRMSRCCTTSSQKRNDSQTSAVHPTWVPYLTALSFCAFILWQLLPTIGILVFQGQDQDIKPYRYCSHFWTIKSIMIFLRYPVQASLLQQHITPTNSAVVYLLLRPTLTPYAYNYLYNLWNCLPFPLSTHV